MLILPPKLIPEGVAVCGGTLEGGGDGGADQAAEITVVPVVAAGLVAVLEDGALGAVLEADALVLVLAAAEHAAGGADSRLVPAGAAAHDVADLDAAGLAVPEADADEEEDDAAEGDGEGDDEVLVVDLVLDLLRGGAGPLEGEVEGGGGGDDARVVEVPHEGDGEVVGGLALEVVVLDLEGGEAPGGGNLVELGELGPGALGLVLGGAVEVVEAEGDEDGGVGVDLVLGLVVVVGIPGDYRGAPVSDCLDEIGGFEENAAYHSMSCPCTRCCRHWDRTMAHGRHPGCGIW